MKDEILTELWSIKDQISAETKGNTRALFERLKVIQNNSGRPIINRTQKRKTQAT